MLTFAYQWVLILVPLPLLIYYFLPPIKTDRPALLVPFRHRFTKANRSVSGTVHRSFYQFYFKTLVWFLLMIALARPQWLEPPIEKKQPTRDLLLLVDLSASMDQEDFENNYGKKTNRLEAVKEVLDEFLSKREGDRIGLVVFGNAPYLQVPFTTDLQLCQQLLDETEVGMAGPKTAFGDAIGLGLQIFANSDAPNKTIIALTDGNDTGSRVPPVEAARIASDRAITIHTVAIGDPVSVGEEKLDLVSLQEVAQKTAGKFYLANDRTELDTIYQQLDGLETVEIQTVSFQPRKDLYYYVVGLILLLTIIEHCFQSLKFKKPSKTDQQIRLRVNTKTFALEATEK